MDDRLLSTPDAAAYLGVKARTFAAHWADWGLTAVRIGKRNQFRLSVLDQFVKDHEITKRTPANV